MATKIGERPIIFTAESVRAVLDGCKTQTRRLIKPQPKDFHRTWYSEFLKFNGSHQVAIKGETRDGETGEWWYPNRYGMPGDRLWVKEAWRACSGWDNTRESEIFADSEIRYEADGWVRSGVGDGCWGKLRRAMFMPRRISRLTLEITGIRAERLQAISERDADAEGVAATCTDLEWLGNHEHPRTFRRGFEFVWSKINGVGSWGENPWVWVIEFRRAEAP